MLSPAGYSWNDKFLSLEELPDIPETKTKQNSSLNTDTKIHTYHEYANFSKHQDF